MAHIAGGFHSSYLKRGLVKMRDVFPFDKNARYLRFSQVWLILDRGIVVNFPE